MLELNNICKSFNQGTVDEVQLFDNFSFSTDSGQFVSIIGSNGSGKTTLLNIVAGSMEIDSGEIILDGQNITKTKEYVRARRLGRVFQDPSKSTVGGMTVLENMAIADNKDKRFNLTFGLNKRKCEEYRDRVASLGLGLEDKMHVRAGSLSGGQRQALALLMATLTPIDLLLLDEHTAALDPRASELVMEITNNIVREKGLTALMVTHNLKFALEYGDRLCMFDKGQIIMDKADEEKANLVLDDVLKVFNDISIESGN